MPELSENQIAELTKKDRRTVKHRLDGLVFRQQGKTKLYDSAEALACIYIKNGDPIDRLREKQIEEIDLDMEIKRKQRIPIEVCNEVNNDVFQSAAGLLKAYRGKKLTEELINEINTKFREIPQHLKW